MHHPTLLSVLLALVLTFSGCLGFIDQDDGPTSDDDAGNGDGQGTGDGGDQDGTGDGDSDPFVNETEFYATIESFTADLEEASAPANITFSWQVDTNDENATWQLDLGDDSSQEGALSDDSDSLAHTYEEPGNYTANFTVQYGEGEAVQQAVNLSIGSGEELPEQWTFEYGASIGCVGDVGCISEELGPGGEEIDGFWQELDERYWGLDFSVEVETVRNDTDCTAYDENEDPIDADLNGAGEFCEGPIPEGTKWLFLYSYVEPADSMELLFFEPE